MEKKNVNLNNETKTGEEKEKKNFGKAFVTGVKKTWNSKPVKVIRAFGEGAAVGLGLIATVYCGTRLGFRDGINDSIKSLDWKDLDSLPASEPEVPFAETTSTEPTEDTAE